LRVEYGDIIVAKFGNDIEMVGRVEGQHGGRDGKFFTDIEVFSTKNYQPKDIKRYVILSTDIVRKIVVKEKVRFD
jgi:hypothetical protein